ncbi:MAG: hypothetical protein AB9917_13655 [Negativicutes bacterium]
MSLGTNVIDSRDILLGTGKVKFGGVTVGQLKGDVVFTPSKEYKEFKAGVPQQTVKILPFSEGAALKASMAELNGKNIARALGNAASSVADTTANVTAEAHTTIGIVPIKLLKGREVTSVVVKKAEITAALTTDYTLDAQTGTITPVTGSTILTDGSSITVDYTYVSIRQANFGGGAATPEAQAEFVYDSPDGDQRITVIFHKANWKGGNPITFKEEDFAVNDFEIVAVSDSTKPAGQQLGYVKIEYFPS